jgi:hypothetical protein
MDDVDVPEKWRRSRGPPLRSATGRSSPERPSLLKGRLRATLTKSDVTEPFDAIRAGGDIDVIRRGVELVLPALTDTEVIGAERYERAEGRSNWRNGTRDPLWAPKAGHGPGEPAARPCQCRWSPSWGSGHCGCCPTPDPQRRGVRNPDGRSSRPPGPSATPGAPAPSTARCRRSARHPRCGPARPAQPPSPASPARRPPATCYDPPSWPAPSSSARPQNPKKLWSRS